MKRLAARLIEQRFTRKSIFRVELDCVFGACRRALRSLRFEASRNAGRSFVLRIRRAGSIPMTNFLGIEIGGTKLQLVTGDAHGIVDRQSFAVQRAGGGAAIREQIQTAITVLRPRFNWAAIGVGYGGPVDWKTGVICCSHHVEGWNGFPLRDWLREISGVPVVVENDTNAATYGEAIRGAGTGFNPVFYTNSGSGVGGGLVVDGQIYHGAPKGEAEFGHVRLDRRGSTVEDRCSGWAVDRKVREAATHNPKSVLGRMAANLTGNHARALAPALCERCPLAQEILNETAADLAFGLSHVVHLFHPEVIILGGGLALIGEPWRATIASVLPSFLMNAFAPGPEVRLAALGEDTVPVGALILAELAKGVSPLQ